MEIVMQVSQATALQRLVRPAALAIAFGAFALAGSAASAADCVNGYRTLDNVVILVCDEAEDLSGATALFAEPAPAEIAPIVTGSVPPATSGPMVVEDIADCQPGKYRMVYWEDQNLMLACGND
jgi:hypothetical protein